MPGWMGLRGLATKSVHDMERERRDTQTSNHSEDLQRRADEKVQAILQGQQGDMTAFTASADAAFAAPGVADGDICGMPLGRIMSSKVAVLSYDDSLLVVQGIFAAVRFRHLPVVDDNGGIIGIVSDRDILRMASPFFGTVNEQTRDKEIMVRKVGVSMTRNPVCARTDTTVLGAIKMMNTRKISCLPVIESAETRKLLGIVTWKDIVRAFCPGGFDRASESQRLKTGVKAGAKTHAAEDGAAPLPAVSEETRVIEKPSAAAAAASTAAPEAPAHPRTPLPFEKAAELASKRLAARVRAARGDAESTDVFTPPGAAAAAPSAAHADPGETPFFPLTPPGGEPSAPVRPRAATGEATTKVLPKQSGRHEGVHALTENERLSQTERLRQSERIRDSERIRLAKLAAAARQQDNK